MDLNREQAGHEADVDAQYQSHLDGQYQEWCEREYANSEAMAQQDGPCKASHTPGPWKVVKGQHRQGGTDEYEAFHYVHGAVPVCDINDFADEDEADATAALISAAPDLLDALKAFAALDDFSGWHPRYFDAIKKAQAAIAKAEQKP